jgi:hypothetical protein
MCTIKWNVYRREAMGNCLLFRIIFAPVLFSFSKYICTFTALLLLYLPVLLEFIPCVSDTAHKEKRATCKNHAEPTDTDHQQQRNDWFCYLEIKETRLYWQSVVAFLSSERWDWSIPWAIHVFHYRVIAFILQGTYVALIAFNYPIRRAQRATLKHLYSPQSRLNLPKFGSKKESLNIIKIRL